MHYSVSQTFANNNNKLCRKKNHRKSEKTFYFFYYDKREKENITNKWHAKDKDEREKIVFSFLFVPLMKNTCKKTIESKKYAMV